MGAKQLSRCSEINGSQAQGELTERAMGAQTPPPGPLTTTAHSSCPNTACCFTSRAGRASCWPWKHGFCLPAGLPPGSERWHLKVALHHPSQPEGHQSREPAESEQEGGLSGERRKEKCSEAGGWEGGGRRRHRGSEGLKGRGGHPAQGQNFPAARAEVSTPVQLSHRASWPRGWGAGQPEDI